MCLSLGMLSKNRGQVLRVAAILNVVFDLDESIQDSPSKDLISPAAMVAAINFVEVAAQQTAYISGRGKYKKGHEEVK